MTIKEAGEAISSLASYSHAVIAHVKAVARENLVSIAIRTALIFSGTAVVLIAVSFLMYGAAKGLAKGAGNDLWLGYLATGTVFILAVSLLFVFISSRARKESLRTKVERIKAAETLARNISELTDVKKWTREYPFYATGAAVAAGFTLSKTMAPPSSRENDGEGPAPDIRSNDTTSPIVALCLTLAEDLLKEAFVPFIKEQLEHKEDRNETDRSMH